MTIAQIMRRMIAEAGGNHHDINHFMKVWAYARTIGALEGLDEATLFTLEAAAIVHDIACPLCREKYGDASGKHQEAESEPLVRAFFEGTDLPKDCLERVVTLVGRHHTYTGIDGADCQILIEADYLVNAEESGYSPQNLRGFSEKYFKTEAGRALLRDAFGL